MSGRRDGLHKIHHPCPHWKPTGLLRIRGTGRSSEEHKYISPVPTAQKESAQPAEPRLATLRPLPTRLGSSSQRSPCRGRLVRILCVCFNCSGLTGLLSDSASPAVAHSLPACLAPPLLLLGSTQPFWAPPSPYSQKQQALGLPPSLPEATCTCSRAWRGDKCFPDNERLRGEQTYSKAPAAPLFCALNSGWGSGLLLLGMHSSRLPLGLIIGKKGPVCPSFIPGGQSPPAPHTHFPFSTVGGN